MHMQDPTCAPEGIDPFLELDEIRALALAGELDLATVRAIRLGSALESVRAGGPPELRLVEAELLSDLCVLRHRRGDQSGARGLARACLALAPEHAAASENLHELEQLPAPIAEDRSEDPVPSKLNPWVRHALDLGQREEGFFGKDVIEVGGAVPEEHARATGAASWSGFYLGAQAQHSPGYEIRDADARSIPWPDQSFDLAFSSCAFEHIQDLGRALREIARVLRPGGVLVTSFAPIWSCAVGHHLWGRTEEGARVQFLDPLIPLFGHLLLEQGELAWFLTQTVGSACAQRFSEQVCRHPHINRVHEEQYRQLFAEAGFDDSRLCEQGPWHPTHEPTPALLAALHERHPGMAGFRSPGFEGVLRLGRKRAGEAPARRPLGRTIFLGVQP
ncbi:MAG: class I SAM-dependent methyltransferase [Planctomycetes bacterium]|nr:class I SAM-dependent methyltransferase [Planctomycetota bacterium]